MTVADQYRVALLTWLALLAVVLPLIGGIVVLLLQQIGRVSEAWRAIKAHEKVLDSHDRALNGDLDKRIEAAIARARP